MKKTLLTLATVLLISINSFGQIMKPVTWSYAAKRINASEAIIYMKATIDKGWHLYSQFVKEGGPVKTTFTFNPAPGYSLIGKTTEPKPVTRHEPTFKMDVSFFEQSAIFQQKIKLKGKSTTVKGKVEFMVCNDTQCLPPDEVEFNVPVK
ncbi:MULTISPECIES: protein-disulfide reductase DsbD domain-containing protein [Pedobacter]|uniref:Thiol:disulfide interchange protein DsbD N-terminal domain-containing protein n=1 Tax=Pedobacter zeae TaxID=1737356 RepID=A0A7W6K9G2_9SPHI|nr:protein-disulfide reductase DsbD domain-containing protein [Pedobacter zeae]MBB4107547.1 hypothetical protein [Pedobacter zeae]GGG98618.1 hypothetical protein GCM10007422_11000 [Pedobacter zeae]